MPEPKCLYNIVTFLKYKDKLNGIQAEDEAFSNFNLFCYLNRRLFIAQPIILNCSYEIKGETNGLVGLLSYFMTSAGHQIYGCCVVKPQSVAKMVKYFCLLAGSFCNLNYSNDLQYHQP